MQTTEPIKLSTFSRTPHLAELKMSYRRTSLANAEDMPKERISSPELAIDYVRRLWDVDTIELQEEFFLVCLSNALEVNGWIRLHSGGLQYCPVDVRMILAIALQTASSAILVAHNHPSGCVTPSGDDYRLTKH